MRVLVAYASAHGSTQGIAERVADALRGRGVVVTCAPVARVGGVDGYDALVVGSAIHSQAWLPEAADFLTGHAAALRGRPLWLFSVGMPGALGHHLRSWAMREGPKVVEPFAVLHPRGSALFTGAVSPGDFPFVSRIIFRLMGGRWGDHRDWVEVDRWAAGIVHELLMASI